MSRLASVTLAPMGCVLVLALGQDAAAGEFSHKHAADGSAQIIQLPAQQVVVETTRPRVIVSERRSRGLRIEPFVATFLTPMNLSLDDSRTADSSLSLAHQMEANMMQLERLRAHSELQRAQSQRVIERLSSALKTAAPATAPTDTAVSAQIQELHSRLDRLEKLVILHGDVLRQVTAPKPPVMTPVPENK